MAALARTLVLPEVTFVGELSAQLRHTQSTVACYVDALVTSIRAISEFSRHTPPLRITKSARHLIGMPTQLRK
jgi:hypothetical protein